VGRHGRLTYKKGIIDLLKLLDNRLVPRLASGKETTLVTSRFRPIFLSNRLIFPSIYKRINAGRITGPYIVPSR